MSRFTEFQAELEAIHRQSEQKRRDEQRAALERIRALIAEYDLDASDLGFDLPIRRATGTDRVKYRDPSTGATWTGRGRPPRWLDGKDRTKYAV